MKYVAAVCAFLFFFASVQAQTDKDIDALTFEMCKTLEITTGVDSVRVLHTLAKHFPQFLDDHKIETEEAYTAVYEKVFFRLQKNCRLFTDMLGRSYEPQGDWKRLDSKPNPKLAKKACRKILDIKNFYYLENDGSNVNVTIDNGYWTEQFSDGTYSKLYFKWTGDCEFEIVFIESNNHGRKNFSAKGDIYKYGIFDNNDKGYEIWTQQNDGTDYLSFRLYLKK